MSLTAPMRCSALSGELGEPLAGTAEHRVRWLLLEDRSPWGEKAVADVVGTDIEAAAKERGMRLLLVRRREGDPAADALRRAILVDTATLGMSMRTVTDPRELAGFLDEPIASFGEPVTEPMFLACTNGKRDACCAVHGRLLVGALAADHAARTWECSHLGGHRFAANLVCLPHGIVYGRVRPGDGPALADAYVAGRLDTTFLRGRSSWPGPAQVAEIAVRAENGLDRLEDLELLGLEGGEVARVHLGLSDGRSFEVMLGAEQLAPPRPISCRADELETPVHWVVREVRPGSRAPRTA